MREATEEEKKLIEIVDGFSDLFSDMLFKPGTCSYALTEVQTKGASGAWINVGMELPDELERFDYSTFFYKVEDSEEYEGCYSPRERTLCVGPRALDNNIIVIHEMIHLHESVINELPLYYHDMLYWALYRDLKKKIPELDDIISYHAHILTESKIYDMGGLHDVLFLLKSFDLDIRQGYPLGTVFGYGKEEEFSQYKYLGYEGKFGSPD